MREVNLVHVNQQHHTLKVGAQGVLRHSAGRPSPRHDGDDALVSFCGQSRRQRRPEAYERAPASHLVISASSARATNTL